MVLLVGFEQASPWPARSRRGCHPDHWPARLPVGARLDAELAVGDPTAVQALQALWDNDFVPIVLGTQLFLWGTGISVIRSAALPRWLGWVMVLLGVIGFTPLGFVAAIGSAVLVLVLSVWLSLRARQPVAA
jgi:hypothetical protein